MMHKIGERISSYRKERNMSQEELAALLNVSRQTISKWETGDTLPDVYNAVALAKMFHVSLDVLILGAKSTSGGTSYIPELKEKRHNTNLWAFIVGATGSATFAITNILLKALTVSGNTVLITMLVLTPVLFICWGYAIWGFIKVSRLNHEIKYLEQIELENIRSNMITKSLNQP